MTWKSRTPTEGRLSTAVESRTSQFYLPGGENGFHAVMALESWRHSRSSPKEVVAWLNDDLIGTNSDRIVVEHGWEFGR